MVATDLAMQWRFLSGHFLHPRSTRERMQAVVEGQHPRAAILGCADSRVPVELLFDSGFGDLFVVRNAGTMSTTVDVFRDPRLSPTHTLRGSQKSSGLQPVS